MKHYYSKINPSLLLHAVVRLEDTQDKKRLDVTPAEQFLQASLLKFNKGPMTKPHKHLWKESPKKTITQESMVVVKGKIRFIMYDIDDQILEEVDIEQGDMTLTFQGGHTYEVLEDNSVVYEYKTGPYYGREMDKEWI